MADRSLQRIGAICMLRPSTVGARPREDGDTQLFGRLHDGRLRRNLPWRGLRIPQGSQRQTLLVFEPGAEGQSRPAGVRVEGVTLTSGTAFTTGPLPEILGGFECGGTHYDQARHVFGQVILDK